MLSSKELFENRIAQLSYKFNDTFDFDFTAVSRNIETEEDFRRYILNDYIGGKKIYYRGERINDPHRHLLPTMLRDKRTVFQDSDIGIKCINSSFVFDYYRSLGSFVDVFRETMGEADENHLYNISAFAQHYCDFSPLIDFTKSLYPALSFALKDRTYFDSDIVLYSLELKHDSDYTNDIETANKWLSELNIYVSLFDEAGVKKAVKDVLENPLFIPSPLDFKKSHDEFITHLESLNSTPTPKAKLIDVPTNTRMKFQNGVFLLLTDFQMFNKTYLTKNMRDEFIINKFIISKELCPRIVDYIHTNAPWYSYKYLTDIESAFNIAINKGEL